LINSGADLDVTDSTRRRLPESQFLIRPADIPLCRSSFPYRRRIQERTFCRPWDIASALGVSFPKLIKGGLMQNRNSIEVNILIVTIARQGNFSRTAERLRRTPPLLHIKAASLDRCAAVKLFVRLTRSVVSTAAFARKTDVTAYELVCRKSDSNSP
jgi:hypothetical protein